MYINNKGILSAKKFFRSFIFGMNEVTFKSRINFVNRIQYDKIEKDNYIKFLELNKKVSQIPTLFKKEPMCNRTDILKSQDFYTEGVRTCTAGGVINTKTGEAAGFHIFDNLYNDENVDEILENIFDKVKNPDRALLLGSKLLKCSIYSIPIFQKIYDGISKRIKNVTIFREHVFPFSESNLNYSLKDDTWTIQSMYRPFYTHKEFDVESMDDLYKCFKEIKIADGDTVEFNAK